MATALKDLYSPEFIASFAAMAQQVVPELDIAAFQNEVLDAAWPARELKQRSGHLASVLHRFLPGAYPQQVATLLEVVEVLRARGTGDNHFPYIFLPDFLAQFGLEEPEISLAAMEPLTQFISCEFAVRPFLLLHPGQVLARMLEWSRHAHPHVRRFASEGCRPRLPWGASIPALIKDPSPVLPILENLKADPSLFVRKSVANHLNDLSKDNPELVRQLARRWKGGPPETEWILRQGCRTLLKKADPFIYQLFQLQEAADCRVSGLQLEPPAIRIGQRLGFSFTLCLSGNDPQPLRIGYAIDYVRAGGRTARKLFHLARETYEPGKPYTFSRTQRFQDFTTRRHFPGRHRIAILVNGKERGEAFFELGG
ncbi:MAG TPA: DNA alkylation repair protein [Chitinophagaceae bacterium]|jgi:3-methyladenine DNA glycosylase AlkC|nr:DNA alkylation repair protein [Chitinophagaceae bacterium]